MPRGDGTGPPSGRGQRGGRMRGNRPMAGPGGYCVCPSCGEKVPHKLGNAMLHCELSQVRHQNDERVA